MRSVTVRLDDLRTTILCLGYVGENEHTRINIDAKKMYDQYPSASASLTVCPPSGASYPAVIERDGDMVIWDITDSDLTAEGSGEIQLSFTAGEVVAKTYIGRFRVSRSIIPTGEIPEPLDDFLTRAGAALTAIPETIDESLGQITAEAETLAAGSSATAVYDNGAKKFAFGIPKGDKGDTGDTGAPGYSPSAGVSKVGDTATITITDRNGTTTASVKDGADGKDGKDGQDGAPGADGFSPSASVTKSGYIATISITDKDGTTSAQISDGDPTALIDDTAGSGDTDKVWSADKCSSLKNDLSSKADVIVATKSGSIVTLTDAVADEPLTDCVVQIEPVQSGSGDPYPPGGGKNLFNATADSTTLYDVTLTVNSDGTVSTSGTASNNVSFDVGTIALKAGVSYILNGCPSGGGTSTYLISFPGVGYDSGSGYTYTPGSDTTATVRITVYSGTNVTGKVFKPMVRLSSVTDGTFAPYSNIRPISGWTGANIFNAPTDDPDDPDTETHNITWQDSAGTVYGGYVNPVTGVLTVDRVIDTINGNSAWYAFKTGTGNASAVVQLTEYQNCYFNNGSSNRNGAISSTGKEAQNYWINSRENEVPNDGDMCFAYSETGQLRFHRTDVANITTLDAFKYAFPETQVVYKLATPITYQLDPVTIKMLSNPNNIWADTGDVEVQYKADTKAYVDQNEGVKDVQVNGSSVVTDGVANVPQGSGTARGVFMLGRDTEIKEGVSTARVITPGLQHNSVFYGLAKAAGNTDQASSSNAVGVYTDDAKLKIQQMFGLWTPKIYRKLILEEDGSTFGGTDFEIGDIELNVWDELVIVIYQSDSTQGQTVNTNNFGYFTIRDVVNDETLAVSSLYFKGDKPSILRAKRFPSVLFAEMVGGGANPSTRSIVRSSDYIDKIRWISVNGNNGTLKAGTTVEVFIHRFI